MSVGFYDMAIRFTLYISFFFGMKSTGGNVGLELFMVARALRSFGEWLNNTKISAEVCARWIGNLEL